MRLFLKVLAVAVLLVLLAESANGQADVVALYTDPAGSGCNLLDTGVGSHWVYVVYKGTTGFIGVEFQLVPADGALLTYLAETVPNGDVLTAGRADLGVGVAMGECRYDSPVLILSVRYQGLGRSEVCSHVNIQPDPRSTHRNGDMIFTVDCGFDGFWAESGHLTVNPNDDCECDADVQGQPSPVAHKTWGGIKALYTD